MHKASNIYIRQCHNGLSIVEKVQNHATRFIRKLSSTAFEMSIPAVFEHFTSAISRYIIEKNKWTGCKENETINTPYSMSGCGAKAVTLIIPLNG
jgi:predicted metal-dependent hydrolase